MAKAVGVGQVAEWFKATVLKTPQGERLKAPNPRISNSYRPRMMRTERTPQRFAMAQMSAQNNRAGKPLARLPALTTTQRNCAMAVDIYDEATETFKSDWLYFIKSEDGYIKIGRSENVENRITRLRTGNRHRLHLAGKIQNSGWSEKLWHFAFQMQRVRGEWFEPNRNLTEAINAALAGKEWIALLKAPVELANDYPQLNQAELNCQWRNEVADCEEILQEKMYDAWERENAKA